MINLALIGIGYWGPNIVRSIGETGKAKVKYICDINERRIEVISKNYPNITLTSNSDDILKDSEIDGVVIATPTATHYEVSKKVLNAGKHVMVEKPLTTKVEHSKELIELAGKNKVKLMVGHIFEYNASIIALKRFLDQGEVGDIMYMSFQRTNLGPIRTDVNSLWDLATHDVSIMCYLLGKDPISVSATGHDYLNKGIEDVAFSTYTFPDNILCHVHASWLNPQKVRTITVIGSKKMIFWDDLNMVHPISIFDKRVADEQKQIFNDTFFNHKTVVVDSGVFMPKIMLNQPLQAECAHFIDCIEKDVTPQSDGKSGMRVVASIAAAIESLNNGSKHIKIEY